MAGVPLSYLQEILRRRAAPSPTQPAPTMPGVEESEADRLYRALLSQAPAFREPRLTERIAAGLTTPSTPIRHKDVGSRSFLRGLVGGFKGSQGFGGPSQGAISRAALSGQLRGGGAGGITPYQLLNLQYRERADKRAEASAERLERGLASLNENRAFERQNKETDNARAERIARENNEDRDLMRAISMGNLSVAQGHLRMREIEEKRQAEAAARGGGTSDAEKRARLGILMKPWEEQVDQILTSKKGKKLKPGARAEFARWLDGIRRDYAQKLGVDLSLGPVSPSPTKTTNPEDPYEGFLKETD